MEAGRAYSGRLTEGEQEVGGVMNGHAEGYTNLTLPPQEKIIQVVPVSIYG